MSGDAARDFRADLERYGGRAWATEPSLWAVAVYRFGRWALRQPAPARMVAGAVYGVAYSVVRLVTGIDIPRSVDIGPGLRIFHFGGINFSPTVRIGSGCRLRHGVTVGLVESDGLAPRIGDDVFIGAYAQILGDVTVGSGARIGAMSVVLHDVPAGATAVGAPARVVRRDAATGADAATDG